VPLSTWKRLCTQRPILSLRWWAKGGDWIAYVTFPEHDLWRRKRDGTERRQLSFPPLKALLPRWSPDGKQIVFVGFHQGEPYRIYAVSAEGGDPQPLVRGDPQPQSDPSWSPDGGKIAFGVSTPPPQPEGKGASGRNFIIRVLNLRSRYVSTSERQATGIAGWVSPPMIRLYCYVTSGPRTCIPSTGRNHDHQTDGLWPGFSGGAPLASCLPKYAWDQLRSWCHTLEVGVTRRPLGYSTVDQGRFDVGYGSSAARAHAPSPF
jgi:hypothetical protein